jgi:hypothetical protein
MKNKPRLPRNVKIHNSIEQRPLSIDLTSKTVQKQPTPKEIIFPLIKKAVLKTIKMN